MKKRLYNKKYECKNVHSVISFAPVLHCKYPRIMSRMDSLKKKKGVYIQFKKTSKFYRLECSVQFS